MPVPDQRDPGVTPWWAGLDVLAQVHSLDVGVLGLGFVDQPAFGATGVEQRPGYYEHYLTWGYDGTVPVAEAIARYGQLAGRPVRHMDYYEVLSGVKFTVIMARAGQLLVHYELVPAENDFPCNNTASQLLARTLGLPPPGGEAAVPDLQGS